MTYNGQKSVHQARLDSVGPCVTNLNFFIDDHVHAHELLTRLGAGTHIRGPSSAARALADYGPDNTRPGADERPFLFMGSRRLIGFDLEIMEPNFLRFSEQSVQFPAHVHPRPRTGDGNLRLERLIVVVEDLETTCDNLADLFAPACRSRPYARREGKRGKALRLTLGGIEIEYCQPLSGEGPLADALSQYGPGVIAIEFSARDLPGALDKARAAGPDEIDEHFFVPEDASAPHSYRIGCRGLTGFDAVLTPRSEQRV
jgi:hypothetical protein